MDLASAPEFTAPGTALRTCGSMPIASCRHLRQPGEVGWYAAARAPSAFGRLVTRPGIFQRRRHGLFAHTVVGMTGILGEDEAIIIAFGLEHRRRAVRRRDPIVEGAVRRVIAIVAFAHFHPDAQRLLGRIG